MFQRVRTEVFADLVMGFDCRDKFFSCRGVDAVVAASDDFRRTDADVDLFRACIAEHSSDLAESRAADDRIVDENDFFAFEEVGKWVEFVADTFIALLLVGFREGSADIVVPQKSHVEREFGALSVTQSDEVGRVGNCHYDGVVAETEFFIVVGKLCADFFADIIDFFAENFRVGA